jgi:quercetin dioxygenase-like cupin family protein
VYRPLLLLPFALFALSGQATAQRQLARSTGDVKFGPPPPFFAPGVGFAVLQGNPGASGEFTVRLNLPNGYIIAPHWHPTDENVTVISGTLIVGMGDEIVRGDATQLTAGGFITAPANMHHYAVAVGKTVVQVHGTGPFAITYVKAKDDPQTASR